MFLPHTFALALLMTIVSTVCWGSWANTYKGVRNFRFELFYWDYAVGIVLVSLLLAFTLGSLHPDSTGFLANVRASDSGNIVSAVVAGVIFNLANLLLVAGIEIAGLAVAFPVSIGIALVVGVVLSYVLQPQGSAALLGLGVLCALVAVVFDGRAYAALKSAARAPTRKGIVVSIVSGLLMGLWAPFVTRAMTRGEALGPYSIAVFFTLGALASCFIFNIYLMRRPLVGEPVSFGRYFEASAGNHFLGLLGGVIWGVGTVFNLVAAKFTGVAISYAIGQAAPMVAAFWGVVAYKEFAGAGRRAKTYLALMFALYLAAIVLVAGAHTAG
jgi:glucose uptake protein